MKTDQDIQLEKRLLKLFEVSQKISATLSNETIMRETCKAIIEEFGFKMVWIGTITPDSFDVKPVYQEGFEDGYLASIKIRYDESPLGMGPTGTAIRTKTPSVINDYESDPRFAPWLSEAKKRGYKSGCAFPMVALEKVLGSINVYSDRKHAFDEPTIMILQSLANNGAIALHNAHLYGELKDMEKMYHSLIENSPDAIGIILNKKIAFLNDSGLRLFEYTKNEIIGKDVSELVHPEDRDMVLNHIDVVLSEGCAPPLEYRVLTKNGEIIYVETARCRIEYEGKPAVQCIVRDIGERKKRDKKLKEMEERYRSLVENSPDAIGAVCDGKIIFINDKGLEMFGYTRDEIIGMDVSKTVSPEDGERVLNDIKIVLSGEHIPPREYKLLKKNGETFDVEITRSKIEYEGRTAIQSTIRDISERKKRDNEMREYIRELEILNKVAIDRELRMIELKKEVNKLLIELGREKIYKITE